MRRRLACSVLFALGVAACSAPPTAEQHQAEGAIEAARAAGAATYAPEQFQAAQAALAKYDEAVAQRDYRQALNDALEARDGAYDAARQASTRKAELLSQANQLATQVASLVADGTDRLSGRGGTRLPAAAAQRVRRTIRSATPVLQEARTSIAGGRYQDAISGLTPVAAALQKDLNPSGSAGRRGR